MIRCLIFGHRVLRQATADGASVICIRCGEVAVEGNPDRRIEELYL